MKFSALSVILLFCGTLCSQVPTAGLGGYWPFDNNANDYSGNGNHGTVYGATPVPDRFSVPNRAYYFDGVTNSIVVNNANSINPGNSSDFSFSYWIKTAPNPNLDGLPVSKNQYGSNTGYQFYTNNTDFGYCTTPGHLTFYTAAGANQDACSNNPIADGTSPDWHFIVGMYNAANMITSLYVDTVLQNDVGGISGSLANTGNLAFGGHPSALSQYYFKGALDGARIYSINLTVSQISQLYHECDAPPAPVAMATKSVICPGIATFTANAAGTISWYATATSTTALGTGTIFSTQSLSSGTYTFYVQNKTCTTSMSRTPVTIVVSECTSLEKNQELISAIVVYPNPVKDNLTLRSATSAKCKLYNLVGELVLNTEVNEGINQLDLRHLASGIYLMEINKETSRSVIKVIKE